MPCLAPLSYNIEQTETTNVVTQVGGVYNVELVAKNRLQIVSVHVDMLDSIE